MSIGPWQILLVLLIVLIIFGAGKLPKVAGDLAQGIKNFRSGMKEEGPGKDEPAQVTKSEAAPEQTTTAEAGPEPSPASGPGKDEAAKS
jgi:sec-independent protein translocase protein TatA